MSVDRPIPGAERSTAGLLASVAGDGPHAFRCPNALVVTAFIIRCPGARVFNWMAPQPAGRERRIASRAWPGRVNCAPKSYKFPSRKYDAHNFQKFFEQTHAMADILGKA